MTNTRLAKQCLKAAVEFLSKQPWNRNDADHPFVVDAEGDPTEMIAVVPGRHAKERGLLLHDGPMEAALVEHWGSLLRAMSSLFQSVTGGQDWATMANPLWEVTHFHVFHFPFSIFQKYVKNI